MQYTHTDTDLPIEDEYPKLIRDFIPELIKLDKGVEPELRVLKDDQEFLQFLQTKLIEEATELSKAPTEDNLREELADVYEVLDAILALKQLSREDISSIQDQKRIKRGGFKKRLLMLKKA